MTTKILFVDDHEIVRLGLRQMLVGTDLEIAEEASTADEGFNKFLVSKYDLAILDVRLPGGDGLQLLGKIKTHAPNQPVLIFSAYDNPTYVARAVALGANGFLLKTDSREKIIDAIQRTSKGESIWSREELRRVTGSLATMRVGSDSEIPLDGLRSNSSEGDKDDAHKTHSGPGSAHTTDAGEGASLASR